MRDTVHVLSLNWTLVQHTHTSRKASLALAGCIFCHLASNALVCSALSRLQAKPQARGPFFAGCLLPFWQINAVKSVVCHSVGSFSPPACGGYWLDAAQPPSLSRWLAIHPSNRIRAEQTSRSLQCLSPPPLPPFSSLDLTPC